ncbi:MAG: YbhB/YbcL family Raf kinase inhibitor-like protein [Rhodocyclaceae bacterium]|jgi:Raf kinase inhibitor-like YbhB/YbcL family protein|nr:YbhB/YbcL family Raf kinase inhibitor-like protein [Rhodocyclaceae bacterium]
MSSIATRTITSAILLSTGFAVEAAAFTLHSPDIRHNATIKEAQVFNGFGCTGGNVSPALVWKNPPQGTKSFALLVHDPDAPTGGSGWWHWVVINIPANTRELPPDAGKADGHLLSPGAQQITTDFGAPGWGGPCPPVGDTPHRYHFTLHALKVEKLELPQGATAALAGFMINANSLGKAKLTGLYGRKKK